MILERAWRLAGTEVSSAKTEVCDSLKKKLFQEISEYYKAPGNHIPATASQMIWMLW